MYFYELKYSKKALQMYIKNPSFGKTASDETAERMTISEGEKPARAAHVSDL